MKGLCTPRSSKVIARYGKQGNLSKKTHEQSKRKKSATIFEAGYHSSGRNEESSIHLSHRKSTGY